jgi:gas vesicle protein
MSDQDNSTQLITIIRETFQQELIVVKAELMQEISQELSQTTIDLRQELKDFLTQLEEQLNSKPPSELQAQLQELAQALETFSLQLEGIQTSDLLLSDYIKELGSSITEQMNSQQDSQQQLLDSLKKLQQSLKGRLTV